MAQQDYDLRVEDVRSYGPPTRHWIGDAGPLATLYPAHVVVVSSSEDMITDLITMTREVPHWEDGLQTQVVGCVINGDPLEARQCLIDQRAENEAWNAAHPTGRHFPSDPTLLIAGDQDYVNYMTIADPLDVCVGSCLSYSKIGDLGDIICPVAVVPADDESEAQNAGYAARDWNNGTWVNEAVGVMVGDAVSGGYEQHMVDVMDIIDNTYESSGVPVADVLIESEHPVSTRRAAGQTLINGGIGELWVSGHTTAAWAWSGFLHGQPYPMNELSTRQRVMVYGPSCATVRTSWGDNQFQFARAGLSFDAYFHTSWAGIAGHFNPDYGPGHDAYIQLLLDELANIPPGVRKPMAVVVRDVIMDLLPQFPDYAWGCTFTGAYALSADHDFVPIGVPEEQIPVAGRVPSLRTPGTVQDGRAALRIHLEKAARATVVIYNAQGRKVDTVMDRELRAGEFTYHWNASAHPRGLYFVALELDRVIVAKQKLVNLGR